MAENTYIKIGFEKLDKTNSDGVKFSSRVNNDPYLKKLGYKSVTLKHKVGDNTYVGSRMAKLYENDEAISKEKRILDNKKVFFEIYEGASIYGHVRKLPLIIYDIFIALIYLLIPFIFIATNVGSRSGYLRVIEPLYEILNNVDYSLITVGALVLLTAIFHLYFKAFLGKYYVKGFAPVGLTYVKFIGFLSLCSLLAKVLEANWDGFLVNCFLVKLLYLFRNVFFFISLILVIINLVRMFKGQTYRECKKAHHERQMFSFENKYDELLSDFEIIKADMKPKGELERFISTNLPGYTFSVLE